MKPSLLERSVENLTSNQMKLAMVAFVPIPKKILNDFGNLVHDRLWSQKKGRLENGKGGEDCLDQD